MTRTETILCGQALCLAEASHSFVWPHARVLEIAQSLDLDVASLDIIAHGGDADEPAR